MELTLFKFSIELVLAESLKHFPNVLGMVLHVVRVDQDVVEVDYDADIKHVHEDQVNKPLKGCRGIGETEGHYLPLIRAIASPEGSFPLITFSNANQVVSMSKIDFRVDLCLTRRVE